MLLAIFLKSAGETIQALDITSNTEMRLIKNMMNYSQFPKPSKSGGR